ncbi:MAG: hypothetical protein D6689_07875 [Deltaproteobacteria bacterium]|nr:MAG: hypothetical protein D6689_07875 [Deltaproteobacteria bacterium]
MAAESVTASCVTREPRIRRGGGGGTVAAESVTGRRSGRPRRRAGIAAAAVVALAAPVARGESRPAYGGALAIPLGGEPVSLDPVAARSPAEVAVVDLVCDTLYAFGAGGAPVPRLAAALPRVSADRLVARVSVRAGVRFHDGSPVTPADVARSIERARTDARSAWLLAPVVRVAVDGGDVVVQLSRATPELAALLAAPQTAVTPGGAPPAGDDLVGTGPFRIRAVDRGARRIALDAVDDYFGGRAYADAVELRWYDDADGEARDYEAGRTHASFRGAAAFPGHPPKYASREVVAPPAVLVYVGFARDGIAGNVHVRRALSFAIERAAFELPDVVGRGRAAVAPAAPGFGGPPVGRAERSARVSDARRQLERARRELPALRGDPPVLAIGVDASRPGDRGVAAKVRAALFRVGLPARVVVLAPAALHAAAARGAVDLYVGHLALPAPDAALEVAAAFAIGGNGWAARALARRSVPVTEMLAEFDRQLPIVPLFHRVRRAHVRAALGGLRFDALGRLTVADAFVAEGP